MRASVWPDPVDLKPSTASDSARPRPRSDGLRVAFLLGRFPALSETFVLNQLTGLLDERVDVSIFAWASRDDSSVHPEIARYGLMERTRYLRPPPGRLRRIVHASRLVRRRPAALVRALGLRSRGRTKSSLSLLYGGAQFVGVAPFQLVHSQFGTLGLMALALRHIGALEGPIVVSFRGSDLTVGGAEERYSELFRAADLMLPVSELFRDRLIEMGCPPEKIEVHRSGIDLSRFPFRERRPEPGGPLRLLTIARLVEKKGVEYAIRATARIKAEGHGVVLRIVGEGPLRARLEALVRELDLEDTVRFVGDMDHDGVIEALEWAHVLVAPSVTAASGDQEGIPNVLKEAMATGMPVVSTRHSGIPELVEDGESGFLVPEKDAGALAARILHLADHPEAWPAMGRAGRRRIEADYDRTALNERLLDLYHSILSRAGSR